MNSDFESRRAFLKTSVALAANTSLFGGVLHAQSGEAAGPLMAYVGTFSSPLGDVLPTQVDLPPGNGRGIHLFHVNRDTGAMVPVGVHEMGTSPSCLVVNAAGTRLYSSNETDRVGEGKEGTVSAFSIDAKSGQLSLLCTIASGGEGPTYVSIHPSGRFLFVANYFGGSIAVLPILADGRLGKATDIRVDAGQIGPTQATHAPPGSFAFSGHDRTHAHMIQADPSGRFVLHVDLGLDKILSGSSTIRRARWQRMSQRRFRCRRETDRGISIFTLMVVGSTQFRKKAQPSSCLTTTPKPAGCRSVKRYRPYHRVTQAAIFARKYWFQATGDSSMRATVCTTASPSFQSVPMAN